MNWDDVLEQYDLPRKAKMTAVGGTASPKVLVEASGQRYVLRQRPQAFARRELTEYDHALRNYLADRHFPAPRVLPARSGFTWAEFNGHVYEMSCVLPGKIVPAPSAKLVFEAGQVLGRLHELGRDFRHGGKENFVREDHISILQPLLDELKALAEQGEQKKQLGSLQKELDDVTLQLEDAVYHSLEQSVIHGDFHPGNVLYTDSRITAVLDYDYASRQAILRDIGDALMFFAATRRRPVDPDDIWSLTQGWLVDRERTLAFLKGYRCVRPLPAQWPYVSSLMLSRWIQCKLRGSRKVPVEQKVNFVLTDLWDPVHLLKRHYQAWLNLLIHTF